MDSIIQKLSTLRKGQSPFLFRLSIWDGLLPKDPIQRENYLEEGYPYKYRFSKKHVDMPETPEAASLLNPQVQKEHGYNRLGIYMDRPLEEHALHSTLLRVPPNMRKFIENNYKINIVDPSNIDKLQNYWAFASPEIRDDLIHNLQTGYLGKHPYGLTESHPAITHGQVLVMPPVYASPQRSYWHTAMTLHHELGHALMISALKHVGNHLLMHANAENNLNNPNIKNNTPLYRNMQDFYKGLKKEGYVTSYDKAYHHIEAPTPAKMDIKARKMLYESFAELFAAFHRFLTDYNIPRPLYLKSVEGFSKLSSLAKRPQTAAAWAGLMKELYNLSSNASGVPPEPYRK